MPKKPYHELERENKILKSERDKFQSLSEVQTRFLVSLSPSAGPVAIDRLARTAAVNGERIQLEPCAYRLLELLLLRKGKILTTETICNELWGDTLPSEACSGRVGVFVHRLRKSLGAHGTIVQVVRGQGYTIAKDQEP